ncbi:hypothetical protein D9M68_691990 [compost metagenome]
MAADLQHAAVLVADEALFHQVVEEVGELVVEAVHFQQAQRLAVVAELAPGPDLEQLFQGAEAAGQGDEGVGEFGHACLACVHAIHHFQAGQALVADFGVHQALRNHPDDLATGGQGRIGHRAHQAHRATAVDQGDTALGQGVPQEGGGFTVDRLGAGAGTAEHADGTQGHGGLLVRKKARKSTGFALGLQAV